MLINQERQSRIGSSLYYLASLFFLLLLAGIIASCATQALASQNSLAAWWSDNGGTLRLKRQNPNELIVASYNVLNLFDNEYDPGKEDHTFLPLGYVLPNGQKKEQMCEGILHPAYKKECLEIDWTADRLRLKLKQIHFAIGAVGDLPDILGVQEIENEKVAAMLAKELGYGDSFVITDSPDERGIDVAIFYRKEAVTLEGTESIRLAAPYVDEPTRDILKANFRVGQKRDQMLTVYVNHWPSQSSPSSQRMGAANVLKKDIDKTLKDSKTHVIALGDFNTLNNEIPNAFYNVIYAPEWNNRLADAQLLFSTEHPAIAGQMPPDSYWWNGNKQWSKLDRIVLSQNLVDGKGIELDRTSFRIVSPPEMLTRYEVDDPHSYFDGAVFEPVPKHYDFYTLDADDAGFSDHLPVAAKIQLN